jgi:hypothetical protein
VTQQQAVNTQTATSPRILCVMPIHPDDKAQSEKALQSVKDQTTQVQDIITTSEIVKADSLAETISTVLNHALQNVDWSQYDYLFRMDADTILQPDFIEVNLRCNPDSLGYGFTHLIKISTFKRLMNCKFHLQSDDTYIEAYFKSQGYNTPNYAVRPYRVRKTGVTHDYRYFIYHGYTMHRIGSDPLRAISKLLFNPRNVWSVMSYFYAKITRQPQFSFARYTFHKQIRELLNPKWMLNKMRLYRDIIINHGNLPKYHL